MFVQSWEHLDSKRSVGILAKLKHSLAFHTIVLLLTPPTSVYPLEAIIFFRSTFDLTRGRNVYVCVTRSRDGIRGQNPGPNIGEEVNFPDVQTPLGRKRGIRESYPENVLV